MKTEFLFVCLFAILFLLSSCVSSYSLCPAYVTNDNIDNEDKLN